MGLAELILCTRFEAQSVRTQSGREGKACRHPVLAQVELSVAPHPLYIYPVTGLQMIFVGSLAIYIHILFTIPSSSTMNEYQCSSLKLGKPMRIIRLLPGKSSLACSLEAQEHDRIKLMEHCLTLEVMRRILLLLRSKKAASPTCFTSPGISKLQ